MTPQTQTVWPRRMPAFQILGFGLAVAIGFLAAHIWFQRLPLVQAFYLRGYVWEEIREGLPSMEIRGRKQGTDVSPIAVLEDGDRPVSQWKFYNTEGSITNPQVKILWAHKVLFHNWVKRFVYLDRGLLRIFLFPLLCFGVALIVLMTAGGILDRRFNARARNGQRLRGPEVVSRWKFNRSVGL